MFGLFTLKYLIGQGKNCWLVLWRYNFAALSSVD